MTKTIQRLNRQFLDQEWPHVSGYLEDGLLCSEGELSIDQLRLLCAQGHADVFVVLADGKLTGALAIECVSYPNYRAANVTAAGGRGIYNASFWLLLRDWLKGMGYSKVQGYCPPGVARLLRRIDGFRTSYELVRCDL